jgi:hypothetical protein
MTVSDRPGFPCRITLEDRYRASHAIFVSEQATAAADYVDEVPPVLASRVLSLRGFDANGMMADARLAQPGEADEGIRALFANPHVAYIHAHNAVRGCFAAKVERCP